MVEHNITFDIVNIPISRKYIQELGEQYGESIFIIKTSCPVNRVKIDENHKSYNVTEIVYSTYVLKVYLCANGYTATINNEFYHSYTKETITHICKINYV